MSATLASAAGLLAAISLLQAPAQGQTLPTLQSICAESNRAAWVSVSGLCHVLSFYGLGKTDLPVVASGRDILAALTDEDAAVRMFGKSPLLQTDRGVRYALFDEWSMNVDVGEGHRDQCLATFAGLELPAGTPIQLRSGRFSIADLVAESMAAFELGQREIAWSAIALAHYVPPRASWTNRAGAEISFSQIASALLAVDLNRQRCAGIHVFEALAAIARADARHKILDEPARERLRNHLAGVMPQIASRQQAGGMWSKAWRDGLSDESDPMTPFQMSFLATGHLIETLARYDDVLRPGAEVLRRGAAALKLAMASQEIRPNGFWLCPYSHGASALRATREKFAE